LTVYVPCLLSAPVQRVVEQFQQTRPSASISVMVDKPLAQLAKLEAAGGSAAVAITFGEVEMRSLVAAGVVREDGAVDFAVNEHPLAVVAPAGTSGKRQSGLDELTSDRIQRIFIEDPSKSTLGDRAEGALKKLGLWDKVSGKVVRPAPDAMVLAELLAGKADAAVVIKGCLFAEKGKGGAIPKTIRVIGEIPSDAFPPILHQAAPLGEPAGSELAQEFVDFLRSENGREALASAGLTPLKP